MITVVIPSKGRNSLNRAISSLICQTDPNWRCVVVLDGADYKNKIDDYRIIYCTIPKTGNGKNGAGLVRNWGINLVGSEWVCFLDDDDTFSIDYIKNFYQELNQNPDMDICLFKMTYSTDNEKILPPEGCNEIICGQVGISFAAKIEFIDKNNIRFENSFIEDFNFLKTCQAHQAKIVFSNYISYNVNIGFI